MTRRHILGPNHRPETPAERREREQEGRREAALEAVRQRKALERSSEFRRAWGNPEHPKHAEAAARWSALVEVETSHPSYVRAGGAWQALGVSATVEREARATDPDAPAPLDSREQKELERLESALGVKRP